MQRFTKTIAGIMLMTAMCFVAGCSKPEAPNNGGNNDEENTSNNDVRVTTYTPQNITQTRVMCGGDVIVTQGLSLNELGVCWSTELNPTAVDFHLSTTVWNEPFVCTITGLEPGTTYHVRAYALRGLEYYYGEDRSFTTTMGNNGGENGSWNGHEYVDLGLPSGTLWATCNVGATAPEGYGNYYAWGETTPKTGQYTWDTYRYCKDGDYYQLTKYCNRSDFGYHGFTDDLITLLPEDDAATINWGNGWCMPISTQWKELYQNTTQTITSQNGVCGLLFTATNGNSIFLPAAGYHWTSICDVGIDGYYWSSSLYMHSSFGISDPNMAGYCALYLGQHEVNSGRSRSTGLSIRAVLSLSKN